MSSTLSLEDLADLAGPSEVLDLSRQGDVDEDQLAAELASEITAITGVEVTPTEVMGDIRQVQREHYQGGRSAGEFARSAVEVLQRARDIVELEPGVRASATGGQAVELTAVLEPTWNERRNAARAAEARLLARSVAGDTDRELGLAAPGGRGAGSMWQAPPDDSTGTGRSAAEVEGLVARLRQRSEGRRILREPDRHPSRESEPRAPHERIHEHVIGDESPSDLASIERYSRMAKQASGKTSPGRQVRSRLEAGALPQGHRRNPRNGAAVLPPLSRDQQHAGRIAARPGGSSW